MMRSVLMAVPFLLVCAADAQQMYRWVDKDGRVHYTQSAPPAEAKGVQRKSLAGGKAEAPALPYAVQIAAKNFPITLYTAAECGAPCKDARDLISRRGAPFREVQIGTDEQALAEFKRISRSNEVPVIVIGTQVQNGFEPQALQSALDVAGYPRNAPPLAPQAVRGPAEKTSAQAEPPSGAPPAPQPEQPPPSPR